MALIDIDDIDKLGEIKEELLSVGTTSRVTAAIVKRETTAIVKRELAGEAVVLSAKKPRRGVSSDALEQADDLVKEEDADDCEDSGKTEASGEDEGGPSICHGCGRVKGVDASYIDKDTIVPWGFRRGRWCRDCHLTWRTMHSNEHSLQMFSKWLKVFENKKVFQMNVIAWCSLLVAGHCRITAGQIADRVAALLWVFQLVGVSADTVVRRVFNNWPFEASGPGDTLALPTPLSTTAAAASNAMVPWEAADSPPSKLHSKLAILKNESLETLKMLCTDDWPSFKESCFSKPLKEFAVAQGAAAAAGHEDCMLDTAEWVAGFSSAKRFAHLYRNGIKSRGKVLMDKFVEMAPVLSDLFDFCSDTAGIAPLAATLRLYYHRAAFHLTFSTEESVAAAVRSMIEKGFATLEHFKALESAKPPVNLSIWLRTLFWETFAAQFHAVAEKAKSSDDALHALSDDLKSCQTALEDTKCGAIADFIQDLLALRVVLQCGWQAGGPTPTAVKTAMARVGRCEFAAFRLALRNHELWLNVQSAAGASMQVSAQSALAASKLARARNYVGDERLPALNTADSDDGISHTYINVANIVDGTALASLAESLDLVVECCSLWSVELAAENAADVHAWADAVVQKLALISDATWFCFVAGVEAGRLCDFDLSSTAVAHFSGAVGDYFCDDGPLLGFIQNLRRQFAKWSTLADRLPLYEETWQSIATQSAARTAATDSVMMLLALDNMPESAQKALDDWKAKSCIGALRESFLEKGGLVWSHFRKTLPKQPSPPKQPAGVADEVCLMMTEGNTATVSWARLQNIFQDLIAHPLIQKIDDTIREVLQLSFDHFASTLPLKEMAFSVNAEPRSFYAGNTADLVKASSKLFAAAVPSKRKSPTEELLARWGRRGLCLLCDGHRRFMFWLA